MTNKRTALIQLGNKTYYVKGMFRIGVYVLQDNQVCLIDSGLNENYAKEVDELLTEHGFCVSMIINTHYHADHCGGNAFFKNKYNCQIYATKENAAVISNYDNAIAMLWGAHPVADIMTDYFYATSTEAEVLTDEVMNRLSKRGLTILDLSGHSQSMIGVITQDEVCFLGDAASGIEELKKHPMFYIYDVEGFLNSLGKIESCHFGDAIFVPYHADATKNYKGVVAANRKTVLENIDRILDFCKTPFSQDELLAEIYTANKKEMNFYKYAVEGTILRNYLVYMYNKGMLETVVENNILKWKTVGERIEN